MSASGFSHHTALPALAAATTSSTCWECGRREHDGVDGGIGEHLVEARREREAVLRGEVLRRRRVAGDGAHVADVRAARDGIDMVAAPAPEPDDCGVDHRSIRSTEVVMACPGDDAVVASFDKHRADGS